MSHIAPTATHLDELYGPLLPPLRRGPMGAVQRWERHFTPSSLSKLDGQTAASLKMAMDEISAGWKLGQAFAYDTIIIWLVDDAGSIWFAFEELVVDDKPTGVPKYQRLPLMVTMPKLGHPALNGCRPARIAGEIYFDFSQDPGQWVINNNSGRYGRHPSRTANHLNNVASCFACYYVTVTPEYLTVGGR